MKKTVFTLIALVATLASCLFSVITIRNRSILKKTPKAEKWIAFENSELTQLRADFRATFGHDTSDVFDVSHLFANIKTDSKDLSDFTDTADVIDMRRSLKKE